MKIYLCGPINGCTDAECNDWRTEAKKHFKETIDPMRRDYRGREAECLNEIVELDKDDVIECDAVLANCPKPSVGTSMEVFFAWMEGKHVVSIVPDKANASPWLIYHSSVVVETMREAIAWLRGKGAEI